MEINEIFSRQIENLRITDDLLFRNVIEKGDNCLHLLQAIFPKLGIVHVDFETQKHAKLDKHYKGSIFDVLATDQNGRVYDIEVQTTLNSSLGKRSRYYQSNIDQQALQSGAHYKELKDSYVVFLCTGDPFGFDFKQYSFEYRCVEKPEFKLETGSQIIVINSLGNKGEVSSSLQDFIALMNGKIKVDEDNKFINKLQKDMGYLKHDPEWRKNYMNLEMKLQDVRDEAADVATKKEQLKSLKIIAHSLKNVGVSETEIFTQLKQNYGKYFSDTQIRKYMN